MNIVNPVAEVINLPATLGMIVFLVVLCIGVARAFLGSVEE